MASQSLWAATKTFFPDVLEMICEVFGHRRVEVCVVGAADGKFVLPLAQAGHRVAAIDLDGNALFGGTVIVPGGCVVSHPGLMGRLLETGLQDKVTIWQGDFLDFPTSNSYDVVFTSCSWHYSINHKVPIATFINHMRDLVRPGGLLAAEYMLPVEEWQRERQHYLQQGELATFFGEAWDSLTEKYTEVFREEPHVGNLRNHIHRMGFFIAKRREHSGAVI